MEDNTGILQPEQRGQFKNKIFVLISFFVGFLLFDLILFEGFGIGTTVFIILFYAAAFWYLAGKTGGMDKRGLWLLAPIALLSVCFTLYSNTLLALLNVLLIITLTTMQLATMTGNRLYRGFSLGYLIDFFHTAVALPVVNIPSPFLALMQRGDKKKRGGVPVIIGLLVSFPVLLVVLALLSSADVMFEKSMSSFLNIIKDHFLQYGFKVLFGIIAAIPFYSLLFALRGNKAIRKLKFKINFSQARFIDEGVLGTMFVLLNAVYLLFIAVQFGYLFNAFASILPAGINYSSYARRGFFELMGVTAINLGILGCSFLFSKRSGQRRTGFLKGMETVLVVLTLLLIASAFSKMAFYMQAYGLTLLRVYTSWFMLLLAVFFISILVKLYKPKFALTRFCATAFVLLYLGLNFVNVDALVPRYNINLYKSGVAQSVDISTFYNLSDSAVPFAAELLAEGDSSAAEKAREFLSARAHILNDTRWKTFTTDRIKAQNALKRSGIQCSEKSTPIDGSTDKGYK